MPGFATVFGEGVPFEVLLQRARAGCAQALGELLESFRPRLVRFALRMTRYTRPKLEADDLVQETFLVVLRHFPGCRGQTQAQVLAWLRRILFNKLVDEDRFRRSSKRDVLREVPLELWAEEVLAPPDCAGEDLQHEKDCARARRALELLPERQRQIIISHICAVLPISARTAVVRRTRLGKPATAP